MNVNVNITTCIKNVRVTCSCLLICISLALYIHWTHDTSIGYDPCAAHLKLRIHRQCFSRNVNAIFVKSLHCRCKIKLLMYHDLRRQCNVIRNPCRKFKHFDFRQRLPVIRRRGQAWSEVKLFKFLH